MALDPPGTHYLDRITQLDFSMARTFAVAKMRLTAQVDLFNSLNANPVTSEVTTFGAALGTPGTILGPQLVRFYLKTRF